MKIALINENSQAAKNSMICENLKKIVEPMGHEVFNYGMYTAEDETQLTYVMCGLLSAILLNSKAADYVVTGCGTGEGAMLACNSFPGVLCGHIVDVEDAYMFAQINDGNAIAMPFAKGFGWGAELHLQYVFEKLFGCESGGGYFRPACQDEIRAFVRTLDARAKNTNCALRSAQAALKMGEKEAAPGDSSTQDGKLAKCQPKTR